MTGKTTYADLKPGQNFRPKALPHRLLTMCEDGICVTEELEMAYLRGDLEVVVEPESKRTTAKRST